MLILAIRLYAVFVSMDELNDDDDNDDDDKPLPVKVVNKCCFVLYAIV